jgi:hypothetical protein
MRINLNTYLGINTLNTKHKIKAGDNIKWILVPLMLQTG